MENVRIPTTRFGKSWKWNNDRDGIPRPSTVPCQHAASLSSSWGRPLTTLYTATASRVRKTVKPSLEKPNPPHNSGIWTLLFFLNPSPMLDNVTQFYLFLVTPTLRQHLTLRLSIWFRLGYIKVWGFLKYQGCFTYWNCLKIDQGCLMDWGYL